MEDKGTPNVASKVKSLENYKVQYRALRAMMDSYPDTKFMVWTLAPLHRLSTDIQSAARAKQFVDWVKTEWLVEDGKQHPNIYIFDFFNLAAETNLSPENGLVNCLKYEYEISHTNGDSHPNNLANSTIAPLFAEAIVNALAAPIATDVTKHSLDYNVCSSAKTIHFAESGNIVVYDTNGHIIFSKKGVNQVSLNHLNTGVYFFSFSDAAKNIYTDKIIIE